MRLLAITTAIVGVALTAPAFAGRDLNQQYQIDQTIQAKQNMAAKAGPEGKPGAVKAREGKPGQPCYPQPLRRGPLVSGC